MILCVSGELLAESRQEQPIRTRNNSLYGVLTTKEADMCKACKGSKVMDNATQMLSPQDVFDNMKDIRRTQKEHFVVFHLDTRNNTILRQVISIGTINASLVHPREVFEPAVRHLSVQIILAHNHPSGDLAPSEEDLEVNKRLTEAGAIIGIEVLDHVIVTKTAFKSFKEGG